MHIQKKNKMTMHSNETRSTQYASVFTTLIALSSIGIGAQVLPPLQLKDNKFVVRQNGGYTETSLKGINWFGFNNDQTMVDGLWAGGTSFGTDFSTALFKLRLLGFNAVRLPFTFKDLELKAKNKAIPCTILPRNDIITKCKALLGTPLPAWIPPYPSKGICNAYLPNTTTRNRFKWTIQQFVKSGFYVIIDYHPMGKEDVPLNKDKFIKKWNDLFQFLHEDPLLKGRILIDLLNEPDSQQLKWKYLTPLYDEVMSHIYNIDKSVLFMVEGTGQVAYNLNWGDGFVTNKEIITSRGIDDASVFFDTIMDKPYVNNVIISPHKYGPSIAKNMGYHKGGALFERVYNSFGYLHRQGYCKREKNNNKKCKRFPLLIGEFGSTFDDRNDIEHLNDFAKVLRNYTRTPSWAYWAYNENSGDTGGIVRNNWQDLDWRKLDWLKTNMGL